MLQLYFIVMFSVEFVALMLNIESFDRCRGTGTFIEEVRFLTVRLTCFSIIVLPFTAMKTPSDVKFTYWIEFLYTLTWIVAFIMFVRFTVWLAVVAAGGFVPE